MFILVKKDQERQSHLKKSLIHPEPNLTRRCKSIGLEFHGSYKFFSKLEKKKISYEN